jgi:chemotaxis protein methyltransferase CheR
MLRGTGMELESRKNGKPRLMNEEEFRKLSELIHNEFGIVVKGDRKLTLHTKLAHRLGLLGVETYTEYIEMVLGSRGELAALATEVTNNETFFQREKNQFDAFAVFLNEIKSRKVARGEEDVRIISAGCSTGEEAYGLSILLWESALFAWGNWNVTLIGIDVDRKALRRARRAVYTKNSFRLLDEEENFISKYFHHDDGGYRLKMPYKKPVKFRHGNLMDPAAFKGLDGADAVFCRNVFIYMSDEAIARIARNIYSCLDDEGFLFIGSTETLIQKTDLFVPECREGIVVYRKRPGPLSNINEGHIKCL